MIERLLLEEDGQTLVEYGLLISVVALVVVSAMIVLGRRVKSGYNAVATQVVTVTS